jgi:hypothetical protein
LQQDFVNFFSTNNFYVCLQQLLQHVAHETKTQVVHLQILEEIIGSCAHEHYLLADYRFGHNVFQYSRDLWSTFFSFCAFTLVNIRVRFDKNESVPVFDQNSQICRSF